MAFHPVIRAYILLTDGASHSRFGGGRGDILKRHLHHQPESRPVRPLCPPGSHPLGRALPGERQDTRTACLRPYLRSASHDDRTGHPCRGIAHAGTHRHPPLDHIWDDIPQDVAVISGIDPTVLLNASMEELRAQAADCGSEPTLYFGRWLSTPCGV